MNHDQSQSAWKTWWDNEGSAMRPLPTEDTETFARRITEIAWSNGAYCAVETAIKERDEARRDACAFEGIINFNEQHPKGLISTEAVLVRSKLIATMRGWNCFRKNDEGEVTP